MSPQQLLALMEQELDLDLAPDFDFTLFHQVLRKDHLDGLVHDDPLVFIDAIIHISKEKLKPKPFKDYLAADYDKLIPAVESKIRHSLMHILTTQPVSQEKLIQLISSLSLASKRLFIFKLASAKVIQQLFNLELSTESLDVFLEIAKLLCGNHFDKQLRMTLTKHGKLLKMGKVFQLSSKDQIFLKNEDSMPKCFGKIATKEEELKLNAMCTAFLAQAAMLPELHMDTQAQPSQHEHDRFFSFLHHDDSFWMLQLLSTFENSRTKDLFINILEATIDPVTMRYVGAQQYISQNILTHESMVLAAQNIKMSLGMEIYFKDVLIEYTDGVILKYPVGVYEELVDHTGVTELWQVGEYTRGVNSLLDLAKAYFNLVLKNRTVVTVHDTGFIKLNRNEQIIMGNCLLRILKNLSKHEQFFNFFSLIYRQQVVPLAVSCLEKFLKEGKNAADAYAWEFFGAIGQVISMHMHEESNLPQIMKTSLTEQLSHILQFVFPPEPSFIPKLIKIYNQGYDSLLKINPNKTQLQQNLLSTVLYHLYRSSFVYTSNDKLTLLREHRMRSRDKNPVLDFVQKLMMTVDSRQRTEEIISKILDNVVGISLQEYLSDSETRLQVVRVVHVTLDLLLSIPYFKNQTFKGLGLSVFMIITKFPVFIELSQPRNRTYLTLMTLLDSYHTLIRDPEAKLHDLLEGITDFLKGHRFQLSIDVLLSPMKNHHLVLQCLIDVNRMVAIIKTSTNVLDSERQSTDIRPMQTLIGVIKFVKTLFGLLEMLINLHIYNTDCVFQWLLSNPAERPQHSFELTTYDCVHNTIKAVSSLLSSFIYRIHTNQSFSVLERDQMFRELYKQYADGVLLLFQMVEKEPKNKVVLIIVAEALETILLSKEGQQVVTLIYYIHERLKNKLFSYLDVATKATDLMPEDILSTGFYEKEDCLALMLSLIHRKLDIEPYKTHRFFKSLKIFIGCLVGLKLTPCNWNSSMDGLFIINKGFGQALVHYQFENIIRIVTGETLQIWEDYLSLYIKNQLLILPHNEESRHQYNRRRLLERGRQDGGIREVRRTGRTSRNRFIMDHEERVERPLLREDPDFGQFEFPILPPAYQHLTLEPNTIGRMDDTQFQQGMKKLKRQLIEKLLPSLYNEEGLAGSIILKVLNFSPDDANLKGFLKKVITNFHICTQAWTSKATEDAQIDEKMGVQIRIMRDLFTRVFESKTGGVIPQEVYKTALVDDLLVLMKEGVQRSTLEIMGPIFELLSILVPSYDSAQTRLVNEMTTVLTTCFEGYQALKVNNSLKEWSKSMGEVLFKTMIHVLKSKDAPFFRDLYVEVLSINSLPASNDRQFTYPLLFVNPDVIKANIEAEIKSFLLTKDKNNKDGNLIYLSSTEFFGYFSKYNKYPPFAELYSQFFSKVQQNSTRRGMRMVYIKSQNSFSHSVVLKSQFIEYQVRPQEMQILNIYQRLIMKEEVLSDKGLQTIKHFLYKIGILLHYFLFSKIQGVSFLELMMEKCYKSPSSWEILLLICLDRNMVISIKGKDVQYSDYIKWSVIRKIYKDLADPDFKLHYCSEKKYLFLILVQLLQLTEVHNLVNLPYSEGKPSLRELVEEIVDPKDVVAQEALFLIFKQSNIEAIKGLYKDTSASHEITSKSRFQDQIIGLPFIYHETSKRSVPNNPEDRREQLREEMLYEGEFVPFKQKLPTMEVEEVVQQSHLESYYTQLSVSVLPPRSTEESEESPNTNTNPDHQKETKLDFSKFQQVQNEKREEFTIGLTFVNNKNRSFNRRFRELQKLMFNISNEDEHKEERELPLIRGIYEREDLDISSDSDDHFIGTHVNDFFQIGRSFTFNFGMGGLHLSRREAASRDLDEASMLHSLRGYRPEIGAEDNSNRGRRAAIGSAVVNLIRSRLGENRGLELLPLRNRDSSNNIFSLGESLDLSSMVRYEEFNPFEEPPMPAESQAASEPEEAPLQRLRAEVEVAPNVNDQLDIAAEEVPLPAISAMIEEELIPVLREVLSVLGLPQSFLRDNGMDQSLFDQLPRELQVEHILFINSQNNVSNSISNAPEASQAASRTNPTLDFLQNIPEELREQVLRAENFRPRLTTEQEEAQMLAATITSMEDPLLREEMLIQIPANVLANLPNELQAEAQRIRRNRENRPQRFRIDDLADINEYRRLRGRHSIREPVQYPDISRNLFKKISEETVHRLLETLFYDYSNVRSTILEAVLENKQMQQPLINTLLYILRDPLNAKGFPQQICSFSTLALAPLNVPSFKAKILNLVYTVQKNMVYKDKTFLKEKFSYRGLLGLTLEPRREILCEGIVTEEYHYPFMELLLESLRHNSPLSGHLLEELSSEHTPSTVLEGIVEALSRSDVANDFIANLKGLSNNAELHRLFNQRFSSASGLKLHVYGRLLQYKFAETPYIKELHIEALSKYRPEYNDFINQVYKLYSVQELKELKELESFKDVHHKVIKHLLSKKSNLSLEPISIILSLPSMVSFGTKREVFYDAMKRIKSENRVGRIQIRAKRGDEFQSSYKQIMSRTKEDMKGELKVEFLGEKGSDMTGLTKEWFIEIGRQMLDPNYGLFEQASSGNTVHPDSKSYVNPDHLNYFRFIGRVVGKALLQQHTMDIHLTYSFYKLILGDELAFEDMESFDLKLYNNMLWLKNNSVDDLEEMFTYTIDRFDEVYIKELVPNGCNISVTDENKIDFINRRCIAKMKTEIEAQTKAFAEGLFELVPYDKIRYFSPEEFELLIAGMQDIDINDFKHNTEYERYEPTDDVIKWFWDVMGEFNQEELSKMLQFITGSNKVPVEGFRGLRAAHGRQRVCIRREMTNNNLLPKAHACFNQLDLPPYRSREEMEKMLRIVINYGVKGFDET